MGCSAAVSTASFSWPWTGGSPVNFDRDFPVCRAAVTYPTDGYAAVFGWTQMVCSTDSTASGFEMDPIPIYPR